MLQDSRVLSALRAFLVFAVCCGVAGASPIFFVGGNGNLKASALFDNNSLGNFTLTLSNLGTHTADESQVLVGVFFKVTDPVNLTDIALTPYMANLAPDSDLAQQGSADPAKVGENWAYASGLSLRDRGYGGANQGVTSAGLSIFGSSNPCFGPCSVPLGGGAWGLVHHDFTDGAGNHGLDLKSPFIRNSVVLTFRPVANGATVSNVFFQYGTTAGTGLVPGSEVPEPSPLALSVIGFAFFGVGLLGRRWRAKSRG